MNYHHVVNSSHQSDFSFYDVQFSFPTEETKIFRVVFLHFSGAAEDCLRLIATIIESNCEGVHGHILTFYDTAWDEIPVNERDGKSIFDKFSPKKLMSRTNHSRLFKGLTAVIEKFIIDKKPEIIYFSAFSSSHQKAYDRLVFSSKSELILSAHSNGKGYYVIKTKHCKTPYIKGF